MQKSGEIQVIYGPMFSGKTSELMKRVRSEQHAKKRCLVVNYQGDNRYSEGGEIISHDK